MKLKKGKQGKGGGGGVRLLEITRGRKNVEKGSGETSHRQSFPVWAYKNVLMFNHTWPGQAQGGNIKILQTNTKCFCDKDRENFLMLAKKKDRIIEQFSLFHLTLSPSLETVWTLNKRIG